ncbi:MAG: gentisate 1,2-dioxygenase [Alphaproteobacteria bacterium]|nr:gentisate 1,2-dioxygenase [Alphaproteobacteria bacterium]
MAVAQNEAQQAFTARMLERNITPLWTVGKQLVKREPEPRIPSVYWNYQRDVRPFILEAADLITAAEAHRRVLVLNNPALKHGATHTMTCAIQAIKGGEIAPAHRHSQAALRFIIEGEGAYTAVNGERIYMHPGDFIVTPAWTWHDHGKETDGVMIWLDGLDVPLVNHLGATFSDDYDGEGAFPQSRPPHDSFSRYGSGLLPLEPVTQRASPMFAYPYERTRTALENLRKANDWDACHGLKLKFANPATGDWVMPTIATFAQLLPKGFKTAQYRSTEATVVMTAEGRGKATVGDRTYTLGKNDIFVVPNWTWWQLEADDDLVLLSYSDRAVLEKLDLWREQRANEPRR